MNNFDKYKFNLKFTHEYSKGEMNFLDTKVNLKKKLSYECLYKVH